MMQINQNRARMRSLFDHILIGLVIVFGTLTISTLSQLDKMQPGISIFEKVQYWFLCDRQ